MSLHAGNISSLRQRRRRRHSLEQTAATLQRYTAQFRSVRYFTRSPDSFVPLLLLLLLLQTVFVLMRCHGIILITDYASFPDRL